MIRAQDRNKVLLYTNTSAMKLIEIKTGSIASPGAPPFGSAQNVQTIPHGLGTSDLLWFCTGSVSGYEPYFTNVSTPFAIGVSGRTNFKVEADATNIYIIGSSSSAGSGAEPSVTFNYKLFIVLP